MSQNGIDASLGLALAIDLLTQNQNTGELRASISITTFLRTKHYDCRIQIEKGRVVSCSLFDNQGVMRPTGSRFLINLDEKSGPFEWKFFSAVDTSQSTASSLPAIQTQTSIQIDTSLVIDDAIPIRLVSELHISWLTSWHENDKNFVQQIFSLVNGKRTVREMKRLMIRAPATFIEKGLVFLIAMKQIEMRRVVR